MYIKAPLPYLMNYISTTLIYFYSKYYNFIIHKRITKLESNNKEDHLLKSLKTRKLILEIAFNL